ncbi:uncharacterized protein G2W53_033320 [Senna tora]|uniref:Uncharacterized protein n=1 Tax=Senna tora TaxID=362788 RepID=A0A834WCQ3_9FABA|nr:uncharacterized protein G2W53_033320 [Senna tora]
MVPLKEIPSVEIQRVLINNLFSRLVHKIICQWRLTIGELHLGSSKSEIRASKSTGSWGASSATSERDKWNNNDNDSPKSP